MQRSLLDGHGHAEAALRAVQHAHHELTVMRQQQVDLVARRDEAQRRADWLRHVVSEIDAARIRIGEEEGLDRDANRLGQAGALSEHASRLIESIDDEETGARAGLTRAERALHPLERLDPETSLWRELLDGAYAALDELSRVAQEYVDGIAEDPNRLAELERRRDLLHQLRRKHGATLSDVIATRDAARAELDLLDTAELDLRGIAARIGGAEQKFYAFAVIVVKFIRPAIRGSGGRVVARRKGTLAVAHIHLARESQLPEIAGAGDAPPGFLRLA